MNLNPLNPTPGSGLGQRRTSEYFYDRYYRGRKYLGPSDSWPGAEVMAAES